MVSEWEGQILPAISSHSRALSISREWSQFLEGYVESSLALYELRIHPQNNSKYMISVEVMWGYLSKGSSHSQYLEKAFLRTEIWKPLCKTETTKYLRWRNCILRFKHTWWCNHYFLQFCSHFCSRFPVLKNVVCLWSDEYYNHDISWGLFNIATLQSPTTDQIPNS